MRKRNWVESAFDTGLTQLAENVIPFIFAVLFAPLWVPVAVVVLAVGLTSMSLSYVFRRRQKGKK